MRPEKLERDSRDGREPSPRVGDAGSAELSALDTQIMLAPNAALLGLDVSETSLNVEALHRAAFVQLPLGVGYADRDGRFIWCNQAFDELLGLSHGEHKQNTIRDLTHASDFESNDQLLKDLWAGRISSYAMEKRYVKHDGTALWARVTAALVRNALGDPICSVGFLEDISSRKVAELALQQSQRMIEAVAANVPVALLACDQTGGVIFSNKAATELYNSGPTSADGAAVEGQYCLLTSSHGADGVTPLGSEQQPLVRALQGESLTNFEFVLTTPDQTRRTLLANACPLKGTQGEPLGAVAVLQDITHLRETEAEVERIHKDLMDASRQAGMAEVATNVLHNVGNVLNSVNVSTSIIGDLLTRSRTTRLSDVAALLDTRSGGVAQLLASDEKGRQLAQYLTSLAAQLQAERQNMLDEIATLRANLDHIKEAVTMQQAYAKRCGVAETVSVVDMVEDSLRMNAGALTRHKVALRRDYQATPEVVVEKHKVLQILVNLLRNAKYACDETGKDDKCVTVRVEAQSDSVRISVCDNGVGIAPETMKRLFGHGFTTRPSGHGFGLHSAALSATELGGSLTASSEGLGHGATFTLQLPLTPLRSAP